MRTEDFPIAVVIPTYNRAVYLREAVESALHQNLPPTGVYVVDDASTDETPKRMQEWYRNNPKVHYIRLSENKGPAHARLVGVQASEAPWIAFLDSDDVWEPTHLSEIAQIATRHPNLRLIYTQRGHIDQKGRVLYDSIIEKWSGNILDIFLKRIIFRPSQIAIERDRHDFIHSLVHMTINNLIHVEDYVFGVLCAYHFPDQIHVSSARTVWMRVHESQSYMQVDRLKANLLQAVEILFEALPDLMAYKPLIQAANLYHASYFYWRAGNWGKAWQTWIEGFRTAPQSVKVKDFWVTLSRLPWPPRSRTLLKSEG